MGKYGIIFIQITLFFCFSRLAYSIEKSESFLIKVYDGKVKVVAPSEHNRYLTAIVENKTLGRLLGKLEKGGGAVIDYISLKSGASKSVRLNSKKGERVFFIPMAPASQSVELIIGRRSYEIPPKR